jgi:hypothetical protein
MTSTDAQRIDGTMFNVRQGSYDWLHSQPRD